MKTIKSIAVIYFLLLFSSTTLAFQLSDCTDIAAVKDKKEIEFFGYLLQKFGSNNEVVVLHTLLGIPKSSCIEEGGRRVLVSASSVGTFFQSLRDDQKVLLFQASAKYWGRWLCTIPNVQQNSPYDTLRLKVLGPDGATLDEQELYPRRC